MATTADGDPVWSQYCGDCTPALLIQGGAWGWRAHRHHLHGEGVDPGPHPPPAANGGRPLDRKPWTEADRVAFHQRNRTARRKARYAPTPARGPMPPRASG